MHMGTEGVPNEMRDPQPASRQKSRKHSPESARSDSDRRGGYDSQPEAMVMADLLPTSFVPWRNSLRDKILYKPNSYGTWESG